VLRLFDMPSMSQSQYFSIHVHLEEGKFQDLVMSIASIIDKLMKRLFTFVFTRLTDLNEPP
jgi:hypothetical protein